MYLHHSPEYRRWHQNALLRMQQSYQMQQCAQVFNQLCADRKRKIIASVDCVLSLDTKKSYKRKKFWESPICKLREQHCFYKAILPALKLDNSEYENYYRMSVIQYEKLFHMVAPLITKQYVIHKPIDPGERLSATLRFLASGDSLPSMHYQYLFGTPTASNIFVETCDGIWKKLQPEVLPDELSTDDWLDIAKDYETKLHFPHCVGSIDGKHINIQCPDNAGSMNYNYKHSHSIVLLASCDANYIFRFVDIGAYGRRSDGGIFRSSILGRKLEAEDMNLPGPTSISDVRPTPLPHCLVGDEAFPLKSYLMRPYPGKENATLEKRVFNYRLSLARKIIENAFGILASRFRIFINSIVADPKHVVSYVRAAVCLHNWLRLHNMRNNTEDPYLDAVVNRNKSNELNETPGAFGDVTRNETNNSSSIATNIREEFCSYFNKEGALDWQYQYI